MPLSTLSLETSKKIFKLLTGYNGKLVTGDGGDITTAQESTILRPNFAELIRILPKIGKAKEWGGCFKGRYMSLSAFDNYPPSLSTVRLKIVDMYMKAESEEQGMKEVDAYLNTLI